MTGKNGRQPLLSPANASLNSGYGSSADIEEAKRRPVEAKQIKTQAKKSCRVSSYCTAFLYLVGMVSFAYAALRIFQQGDESAQAEKNFRTKVIPELNAPCFSVYNTTSEMYPNQPLCAEYFSDDINNMLSVCKGWLGTMCGDYWDYRQISAAVLGTVMMFIAIYRSLPEEEQMLGASVIEQSSVKALVASRKNSLSDNFEVKQAENIISRESPQP